MKKVSFDGSFITDGNKTLTKTTPDIRDRSDISSRWNTVASKKNRSEVKKPNQKTKERAVDGGKHSLKHQGSLALRNEHSDNPETFDFDEESALSPFDLFQEVADGRKKTAKGDVSFEVDHVDFEEGVSRVFKGDSFEGEFKVKDFEEEVVCVHEDAASFNPIAGTAPVDKIFATTDSVETPRQAAPVSEIDALVKQLVDEVDVMKHEGRTETTIQIKNSPTFEGVRVTITEFDTAKNELNIKFENLTQRAHEIVSKQVHREELRTALEQKGYQVHIITANTEIEKSEHTFKGNQDRSGGKREQQQENPRQQQRQKQR